MNSLQSHLVQRSKIHSIYGFYLAIFSFMNKYCHLPDLLGFLLISRHSLIKVNQNAAKQNEATRNKPQKSINEINT